MSNPSKFLLNPLVLAASGIILLGAVAVFITSSITSEDSDSGTIPAKRIAKSSGRPSGATDLANSGEIRKSRGKTDEEKKGNGKGPQPVVIADKSKRKELMIRVSVEARNELKALREKYRTEFDTPESRKEFSDQLRSVTDADERKRLLTQHEEARRIARNKMDAEKGFPGRAREKRLIALMQAQNLWRMNSIVAQNNALKAEAEQFDDQLAEWVANSEDMSEEEFQKTYNTLRNTLTALRARNGR